jgi:hypothetical protein
MFCYGTSRLSHDLAHKTCAKKGNWNLRGLLLKNYWQKAIAQKIKGTMEYNMQNEQVIFGLAGRM